MDFFKSTDVLPLISTEKNIRISVKNILHNTLCEQIVSLYESSFEATLVSDFSISLRSFSAE